MKNIFIPQLKKQIEVPEGENLMKALLVGGIPVASSCHGDGVCAKCKMFVEGAPGSTSAVGDLEQFLIEKFQLKPGQRISCQVQVTGDIKVGTTYW